MRKITVNLAPSSLRKAGSGLDLAMAVGVLVASDQVPGGRHRRTGLLRRAGSRRLPPSGPGHGQPGRRLAGANTVVVPAAASSPRPRSTAATRCAAPVAWWRSSRRSGGTSPWPEPPEPCAPVRPIGPVTVRDLADVRGQAAARTALEVAAAGGHHLLMVGPPGAGKTMLASRLPGLLPPLGVEEALAVARIRSAVGEPLAVGELPTTPPFRAPHHTASPVALTGGGSGLLRPGEVSRASRTGCCSSTSWASSPRPCSTPCASPWRRGSSASPGPRPPPPSRPGSCWSGP